MVELVCRPLPPTGLSISLLSGIIRSYISQLQFRMKRRDLWEPNC